MSLETTKIRNADDDDDVVVDDDEEKIVGNS